MGSLQFFMFFDRGTLGVLPLAYFYLPRSAARRGDPLQPQHSLAKENDRKTNSIHHHHRHHPEGLVYGGFRLDSGTVAVQKITSTGGGGI